MVKIFFLFFILNTSIFPLKISDLNFNKQIPLGESKSKEFYIENNRSEPSKYNFSIEGSHDNISISPSYLLLPANTGKYFNITVKGKELGLHEFFFIIEENSINLKENDANLNVQMKYRIKQKYKVF